MVVLTGWFVRFSVSFPILVFSGPHRCQRNTGFAWQLVRWGSHASHDLSQKSVGGEREGWVKEREGEGEKVWRGRGCTQAQPYTLLFPIKLYTLQVNLKSQILIFVFMVPFPKEFRKELLVGIARTLPAWEG